MGFDTVIFFIVLFVGVVLFLTEYFTVDKTAFLMMLSLLIIGIIDPIEAISGFSNRAVITILCLMIVTYALEANQSIGILSQLFIPLVRKPFFIGLPAVMLLVGGFSAFISTTAVVIIFIRIMPKLAEQYNLRIEKYMMPISFAGILGGSCTLIGTSTNLLVHDIAVQSGLNGFTLFQFSSVGLVLLFVGVFLVSSLAYFFLERDNTTILNDDRKSTYTSVLQINSKSKLIGLPYSESEFYRNPNVNILELYRDGQVIPFPDYSIKFEVGDELFINSNSDVLLQLKENDGYELFKTSEQSSQAETHRKIVELLVLPNSKYIGMRLNELNSYDLDGANPIGLSKHKNILNTKQNLIENLAQNVRIDAGDRLLVQLNTSDEDNWEPTDNSAILNINEVPVADKYKSYISVLTLALVIGLVIAGVFDILVSSLLGVGILIVTRSLSMEKAYKAVNWQIIFMLSCLVPLGAAMKNTGADQLMSDMLMNNFHDANPHLLLTFVFAFTMMVSSVVSNNATAIVLAPVGITLASTLGISPYPFLISIIIAANFSFFTPIGYQTNTMVYGMGIYKFKDFIKVGGIVSLVLMIVSCCIIPYFFPF